MTDLDPEIWNNPTLGAAANNTRLDVVEKQELEDRNARLEDRAPRAVIVDNDYPGWIQPVNPSTGTVPSNAQVVHFADEQQNDIPEGSAPIDETAGGISGEAPADPAAESDGSVAATESADGGTPVETNSAVEESPNAFAPESGPTE